MLTLSSYTRPYRALIRQAGLGCVYAAGARRQGPLLIGSTAEIHRAVQEVRWRGEPESELMAVLWCPDPHIASTIARSVQAILKRAGRDRGERWFDIDAGWAQMAFEGRARDLFSGARFSSHAQCIEWLGRRSRAVLSRLG